MRVVPNGVGEPFVAEGARAEGEYVLAVGTRRAAQEPAAARARRRALAGVELRVAGARGWGDVDVDGDGVRLLGFVPDDELARSTAARSASRTRRCTRASASPCSRRSRAARRS